MNGIDKIKQRIAQDLQQQSDAIRQKAEEEARDILARYAQQAQTVEEEILRRGERDARELEERLAGAAHMEDGKARLAVKQEMLDQAFALALDKLCALEGEDKLTLLTRLTLEAARTGREQVYLAPADREGIGEALIQRANAQLDQGALTLASESRPIRGGVILSDGAVESNNSFESILRLAREGMAGDIVKRLFP